MLMVAFLFAGLAGAQESSRGIAGSTKELAAGLAGGYVLGALVADMVGWWFFLVIPCLLGLWVVARNL